MPGKNSEKETKEKGNEITVDFSKLNIFQKLLWITHEMSVVAKNLNVGIGKGSYNAAGEADILAAVKPLEFQAGVYSYPVERKILEAQQVETVKDYTDNNTNKTTTTKSHSQFMRIEVGYCFVNVHNPEDKITITSWGDGVDPQDKAPGKAMTYADKYAIMKAYKIITGDDPDQNKSGNMNKGRTNTTPHPDGKAASHPGNKGGSSSGTTKTSFKPLWEYEPFSDQKYPMLYLTEEQFQKVLAWDNAENIQKVCDRWNKDAWPGAKKLHMANAKRAELEKRIEALGGVKESTPDAPNDNNDGEDSYYEQMAQTQAENSNDNGEPDDLPF